MSFRVSVLCFAVYLAWSWFCWCHHSSFCLHYVQYLCKWAHTHLPMCVCVCESMMTSPGCSVSFSACLAEADVLVGQNWRPVLPCVRITRWALFPRPACQIHPWKMNFQSAVNDLQARLSNAWERKESLFIRAGKAAGKGLIEVQLFPQTSLNPVKRWKKTLLNNLLCISVEWGAMLGENSGCWG